MISIHSSGLRLGVLTGILLSASALDCAWAATQEPSVERHDAPRIRVAVHGQVSAGVSPSTWSVELVPCGVGENKRSTLFPDGSFDFRGITPGQYQVRLRDQGGHLLYEETVSIQKNDETVWIGLPAEQSAREQTVSIQQLEHRVPRAARKEHEKGMEALRKQQYPAAADHFKAALTFDPQYAAARNDLGVAYVRMRNWDAAAEQFRSVLDAVPGHQPANDNYIVALLQGERFAEAEEAADQILRRGGTPIAHYTVALCIVMRHGNFKEALDHLRLTEQTIPKGRLIAAQILEELGRRADAARALESYMQFAEAEPKLPALEKWLADLRQ